MIRLILASGGPEQTDSAAKIASYFAAHEHTAMVAHLVIDAVAGAAIVAIAFSLRTFLRGADERLARVTLAAGVAAGIASFAQAVVGLLLTHRAAHGGAADNVKTLFTALNDATR